MSDVVLSDFDTILTDAREQWSVGFSLQLVTAILNFFISESYAARCFTR